MSIRLRLTLLYSAILALTLILFGVALYNVVAQVTFKAAQDMLTAESTNLAITLRTYPFAPSPPLALTDTFIQLRRLDGDVVLQSSNLQGILPLDPSTLAQIQVGATPPVPTVVTVGGQQLLLYNTGVTVRGQLVGILQVARPIQSIDHPLAIVRRVLLIGGGLVTVLAFGVGWLLAGAALRPINRITQTAQAIGEARDFGRRVAYSGPPDEVGRLATTFNAMLARLQEAYQAQRRFVADASHELRTPLTTIRGNLGLLQREPPISEADRVAVLADLVAESERMSRLVGDLLTLARADAGRPLRHEAVPVAPLLADIARRLAASHPGRPIHYAGGQDVAVVGDPDALMQVLLILLDNALKFTPPDGDIRVTTTASAGHVAIAVQDTGPGISPEALPHIFERFYQGDTARAGTGTGLGLAIAKALVEALHGTISVESEAGRGSTFVVTLPRAPLVDAPAPSRTAAS
jgi:signal transduction histidine kinase